MIGVGGSLTSSYVPSMPCAAVDAVDDVPLIKPLKADLILALFLVSTVAITRKETAVQITKDATRNAIEAMSIVSIEESPIIFEGLVFKILMPIESLLFAVVQSVSSNSVQTTVCTAKMHVLPLVGTSVQVAEVWLVEVGQLPQFDARILYM